MKIAQYLTAKFAPGADRAQASFSGHGFEGLLAIGPWEQLVYVAVRIPLTILVRTSVR